jgi:hypothetical protein
MLESIYVHVRRCRSYDAVGCHCACSQDHATGGSVRLSRLACADTVFFMSAERQACVEIHKKSHNLPYVPGELHMESETEGCMQNKLTRAALTLACMHSLQPLVPNVGVAGGDALIADEHQVGHDAEHLLADEPVDVAQPCAAVLAATSRALRKLECFHYRSCMCVVLFLCLGRMLSL